mgnify:CR=1 FL=1
MPWTIDFTQDTEAKGTGTATAKFVGAADDKDIAFSLSSRLDTNDGTSIDEFLTAALTALKKHRSVNVEKNLIIGKITLILNEKTQ